MNNYKLLEGNVKILLTIIKEIVDDLKSKPVIIGNMADIKDFVECDFEDNIDSKSLEELFANVIEYCVNTHSNYFFQSLLRHPTTETILANIITIIMNNNMNCNEVSPIMSVIENIIKQWIFELFEFNEETGDILFNSNETISNILAIYYAINNLENSNGTHINRRECRIYISDQSNNTFKKGVLLLGIGLNNIVQIKCGHNKTTMDISVLENAIIEDIINNRIPLMIIGIAGNTTFGTFDNIEEIAKISKKYEMWFHIDAAYGGSMRLSHNSSRRDLLKGCHLANSITWCPHYMLGIPLQCSILLLANSRDMRSVLVNFDYIDECEIEDNSENNTLECNKIADVFKLYVAMRINSRFGYTEKIEKMYRLKEYFLELIEKDYKNINTNIIYGNRINLVIPAIEQSGLNVCFRPNTDVNVIHIKQKLLDTFGILLSCIKNTNIGQQYFFRISFVNDALTTQDIEDVFYAIKDAISNTISTNSIDITVPNINVNSRYQILSSNSAIISIDTSVLTNQYNQVHIIDSDNDDTDNRSDVDNTPDNNTNTVNGIIYNDGVMETEI
jgi:glutamate decarboxylase